MARQVPQVPQIPQLVTERLVLRGWEDSDRDALARLNADAQVMEYFPATLSRAESDAAMDRWLASWSDYGFGMWCAERRDSAAFVGIIGLARATFEASFTPVVEVGWRLSPEHWGQGLASEGGRASLRFGFETNAADAADGIVALTARTNVRSQRVMQRLGMRYEPENDFDHPGVPAGHRIRPHVLHRITRDEFDGLS
jgi:RimJ/RimL family protein N-acetyltransferase